MGAGRKAPVITVEILDHLGAFKRQPTRADTAGENGHRCQKRSTRRLHVRAAGARRQVAARPQSLALPGGNITGFSTFEPEIGGKWLELLKEIAPGLSR